MVDDEEVTGSVSAALETTLASLQLRHEAALHVAAMRSVAARMDRTCDGNVLAKLANTLMRQQIELRTWLAPEPIEEDPFDALARSLHTDAGVEP